MDVFSHIFINTTDNELRKMIRNSINLLSTALNYEDLHRRIALRISITESIFLFDADNYKMEQKCKRRATYCLHSDNNNLKQKTYDLLGIMYKIRHKIQHKSKKLFIDLIQLKDFQILLVDVFISVIISSLKYDSKEIWLKDIDQKSST
jgi:hypothetical protein